MKPCESSFADKFPSLICIRAICKPVCYIRARGEIKRKRGRAGGERAPSLFLRLVIGIIPRIKSGGGSGVAIISIDRY